RRLSKVVKVARTVLHVVEGPTSNFEGEFEVLRIPVMEEDHSINGLGRTLNVNGQGFVIVVTRSAVGQKEGLFPVVIALVHDIHEPIITGAFEVVLEAVQDVSRVKVVHPVKIL